MKFVYDGIEVDVTPSNSTRVDNDGNTKGVITFNGGCSPYYQTSTTTSDTSGSSSGSSSDGGSAGGIISNVSGVLTEPIHVNVATGNIPNGKDYAVGTKLEDIFNDMLTAFVNPSVSLALTSPSSATVAKGSTVDGYALTATFKKGTADLGTYTFYVNNVSKDSGSATAGNKSFTDTVSITDSTTFKVTVSDANGNTSSASKTISFVPYVYWGSVEADDSPYPEFTVSEENVKALEHKDLRTNHVFTFCETAHEYDCGYYVFAYPKAYGLITTIKELNTGWSQMANFNHSELTMDGTVYYVWYCNYQIVDSTINLSLS